MKRIKKYKFLKFKVKADTLMNFADTILKNNEKAISSKFHDKQQKGDVTVETGRKIDDAFSVLAHFGILAKNKTHYQLLDRNSLHFFSESLENALAGLIALQQIEMENATHEFTWPIRRTVSHILSNKGINSDDLEGFCREWLTSQEMNGVKLQKESVTLFMFMVELSLHSINKAIDAPQSSAILKKTNRDHVYPLIGFNEEGKYFNNKYWIMAKPNNKSRVQRGDIFINHKLVFDLISKARNTFEENDSYIPVKEGIEKEYVSVSVAVRKAALEKYGTSCFIDNNHKTFTSKDGSDYIHYHHIVFKSLSKKGKAFDGQNLDIVDNLIPLCPLCHEKLHRGLPSDNSNDVELLWNEVKKRNVSIFEHMNKESFFKIYGIL